MTNSVLFNEAHTKKCCGGAKVEIASSRGRRRDERFEVHLENWDGCSKKASLGGMSVGGKVCCLSLEDVENKKLD